MITLSTLPLASGKQADLTPSDILALLNAYVSAANNSGPITAFGTITAGSAYTNGTYNGVHLTGGHGTGAVANVTVASGAVTAVTLVSGGSGYKATDSLSASVASLGGTGSGFAVAVSTVNTAIGTDAVTVAFANALFSYVSNRFGVMSEITLAAQQAFIAPGSPTVVALEDEYNNPAAEFVNTTNPSGVAATPQNPAGVVIQQ